MASLSERTAAEDAIRAVDAMPADAGVAIREVGEDADADALVDDCARIALRAAENALQQVVGTTPLVEGVVALVRERVSVDELAEIVAETLSHTHTCRSIRREGRRRSSRPRTRRSTR